MPELPEVQTTVDGINQVAQGRIITDVWTDMFSSSHIFHETIKNKTYFTNIFKPAVIGKKILHAERRGKHILIKLQDNTTILIHMKMTGHIMYGTYTYDSKKNTWAPKKGQPHLEDPYNRFIHVVYTLDNGKHLVLCDMRKFAKVTLVTPKLQKELSELGPEPFDTTYNTKIFIEHISKFPNIPIKTALLDQRIVVGIGNIYSDEILHTARILPERLVSTLQTEELKTIYKHIAPTLRSGIDMGGDSMSDYRNIHGQRGKFQGKHKVYRRTGLACVRKGCIGIIERKVLRTRSAHFCRVCQK